jgi:hypothetical protein
VGSLDFPAEQPESAASIAILAITTPNLFIRISIRQ